MSLRRRAVSKFFAVWFVVLIVLPFTAPFQAWDPGAPVKAPSQDDFSSDKLPKDATTAALVARVVPVCIGVGVQVGSLNGRPERRRALQTVLRL